MTLPNVPWDELVARWRRLDELGFETVWVADHLANFMTPEQPWFEGWTCLAGMAAATERARIGTLVSPITLRNPAVLAKAAVTLDHICEGRLELAVGAGGSKLDHALSDVEDWPPPERATRLRAFVERLLEVLGDRRIPPSPVQERIPLTIGGQARGTLRLAAEYADRWNTYGGRGLEPAEALRLLGEKNAELTRFCQEEGRDPGRVRRSLLLGYPFVTETPWRTEEAFLDLVERWSNVGFEEIVFYYPPELGMPEGSVEPGLFEHLAANVMPGLRSG